MKTLSGWEAQGGDVCRYLEVGDEVDEAMVEYFLNLMWPAAMSSSLVQMGEPQAHVDGKPTFLTFHKPQGVWLFRGACLRYQTQQP
jgi:hypothetical protein